MYILDTVNKSLEMKLAGAVTTTEWSFVTAYVDITATAFTPASNDGASTGATAKTIVAVPAASTQRQIKSISIANKDTVQGSVTIQLNNNSTLRTILNLPLNPNEELFFMDGAGWMVFDSNGNVKGVGAQGLNAGYKFSYSTDTANTDPTSGFVKFNNATLASITNMRISGTSVDAQNLNSFIASWDASTTTAHRGWILVYKDGAPANFVLLEITGAKTNNTTWYNFPVTYSSSGGTLSNSDSLRVSFVRTGDLGGAGSTGSAGPTGPYGGALAFDYLWDTGTSDADPGAGKIRGNSATTASITFLYIDLVDQLGTTQTTVLDTLDASTSTIKARIRLSKKSDQTQWMVFTMTTRTTATGYRKLAVVQTGQSGTSPFSNGDEILIDVDITGDLGATGAGGSLGFSGVLTADTGITDTVTYTTGGVTFAAPALANGQIYRVRAFGTFTATSSTVARNAQVACFWGATQLTALTAVVTVSSALITSWSVEFILNATSTTAMWVAGYLIAHMNQAAVATATSIIQATSGNNTGLSTGPQTLDLRFSMSVAVATDTWTVKGVQIERLA